MYERQGTIQDGSGEMSISEQWVAASTAEEATLQRAVNGLYAPLASCGWEIRSDSRVALYFRSFQLEEAFDYVLIYQGNAGQATGGPTKGRLLASLTGATGCIGLDGRGIWRSGACASNDTRRLLDSSTTFESASGQLYVEFSSDATVQQDGFIATYYPAGEINRSAFPEGTEVANGLLQGTRPPSLSPSKAPSTGPPAKQEQETAPRTAPPTAWRATGPPTAPTVGPTPERRQPLPCQRLTFISGESGTSRFDMLYRMLLASSARRLSGAARRVAGSISDGSEDLKYSNLQLCTFVFGMQTSLLDGLGAPNSSYRITLRVTELSLEQSWDFLLIYATPSMPAFPIASLPDWIGNAAQSRLLGRWTGYIPPTLNITVVGEALVVVFRTGVVPLSHR
jgi:hypothetical protein